MAHVQRQDSHETSIDVDALSPADAIHAAIGQATQWEASDVFVSMREHEAQISMRHHGIVKPLTTVTVDMGRRIVAHVKANAAMDLTEHRRPLDGRWLYTHDDGRKVDLRLNSIPTLHGEDLAMRLLICDTELRPLDSLGMIRKQYNELTALIHSPNGLILVSGPTGSGKTTTLYSILGELNDGKRKINTIEDPIEYEIQGVHQSQINERITLDFPELLRSVLRQAPDVIMIGEIRDTVTAQTAVRAANSGHLVLATLHAPTAAGAIASMLALDVHPHFLAACLRGTISQRLLRTLCKSCRHEIDISLSPYSFEDIQKWLDEGESATIFASGKCDACRHEGYDGRTAAYEVLPIDSQIRKLVANNHPVREVDEAAVEKGMIRFNQIARINVAKGITTTEEILRVIPTEHLGLEST